MNQTLDQPEFEKPKLIKHIVYLHGLEGHGDDFPYLETLADSYGLNYVGSDMGNVICFDSLLQMKWWGPNSAHPNATSRSHLGRPVFNAMEYACNCVLDELAALGDGDTQEERYKNAAEHSLLTGVSFGGALATKLMRDYGLRPSGVILGCPALSSGNFVKMQPLLHFLLWPTFRLDSVAFGAGMDPKRMTLIHGESDRIVGVTGARRLKEALPEITYIEAAQTDHDLRDALRIPHYWVTEEVMDVNTGQRVPSIEEIVRKRLEMSGCVGNMPGEMSGCVGDDMPRGRKLRRKLRWKKGRRCERTL